LEARAGGGDELSCLFGLSGLFGSSGGGSDPANQTNEVDKNRPGSGSDGWKRKSGRGTFNEELIL